MGQQEWIHHFSDPQSILPSFTSQYNLYMLLDNKDCNMLECIVWCTHSNFFCKINNSSNNDGLLQVGIHLSSVMMKLLQVHRKKNKEKAGLATQQITNIYHPSRCIHSNNMKAQTKQQIQTINHRQTKLTRCNLTKESLE